MEKVLPKILQLYEEGYHEPLQPWQNPEVDDEEWRTTGWQARNYFGVQRFRHNEREPVVKWLADHGYVDCGDGVHYEQMERV